MLCVIFVHLYAHCTLRVDPTGATGKVDLNKNAGVNTYCLPRPIRYNLPHNIKNGSKFKTLLGPLVAFNVGVAFEFGFVLYYSAEVERFLIFRKICNY